MLSFIKKVNLIAIGISMALSPLTTACSSKDVSHPQGRNAMAAKAIEEVLTEHTKELMAIPGVVGVAQGICNDKPCIKVYVVKESPELKRKIPDTLEGYKVMIEETGEFRPLPQK
jgi:hypothetical protein